MPSLPAVVDFSMVKNKAAESVTEYSSNYVWYVNGGSGNVNNGNNKTNANKVRPCVACAANEQMRRRVRKHGAAAWLDGVMETSSFNI